MMRLPTTRARLVALAALAALAVVASACGGSGAADTAATAAPLKDCRGPVSAEATDWVEPVTRRATPSLPVTVTDASGESQTVASADRILALDTYGTLATTVYALGLGDRLVGRDISTGVPELRDLPVVTHNGQELNAEAILDLNPDLVITDYSIGPLEVQLQLRDAGIPVLIMDDARGTDVIGPQILAVAEALGVPDEGAELATQVEADVAAARAEVAGMVPADAADRLRMVFLYMRGTAGVYYWFGEGSGADDLIESLGGVDVASEAGLAGSKPLNAEGLVKSEPDLYLMMTDGLASVGGVEGLMEVPGVADTNAGELGCVVDMSDYQILSFGPQFPSTLRALADAVYGPDGVAPAPAS